MELNIAFRIYDDLELSRFTSLFAIIPPRLNNQWRITEADEADVIVIDANEPGSEYYMQSCRDSVGALPLLYAEQNYIDAEWYVGRPIRSANLVITLNDIAERLSLEQKNGRISLHENKKSTADALPKSKTNAADYIKQQLDYLSSHKVSNYYQLSSDQTTVIINIKDKTVAVDEKLVERHGKSISFSIPAGTLKTKPMAITAAEADRIIRSGNFGQHSWQQFIWLCYLSLSNGQALTGLSNDMNLKLTEKPDLANLAHTPVHVILTTAIQDGSFSIEKLVKSTQVDPSKVVAFCNACHALNYIEADTQTKSGWSLFG